MLDSQAVRQELRDVLDTLAPREALSISLRYGLPTSARGRTQLGIVGVTQWGMCAIARAWGRGERLCRRGMRSRSDSGRGGTAFGPEPVGLAVLQAMRWGDARLSSATEERADGFDRDRSWHR